MDNLLSIEEMCARFAGTTRGSWAQLRYSGRGGPRWRKVGKRVYYAESDVIAFLEQSARTSTAS